MHWVHSTGRMAGAWLLAALLIGCASQPQLTTDAKPASVLERLEILERKPAFGGERFGSAGEYELIAAVAHVRVDPAHPANRAIVDLAAAADADGAVRYRTNVVVLRPRDPARSSRALVLDVPNRGRKLALTFVNEGDLQADAAGKAGTGWLMREGHTVLWIGWQGDVNLAADGQTLGMALPVATGRGAPISGTSVQEVIFDAPGAIGKLALSYPAASLDPAQAELSVRARPEAPATLLGGWRFVDANQIEFDRPANFDAGAIYQFRYLARDPKPLGLGMAAVRDLVTFFKNGKTDAQGQPQPLADIRHDTTVALGISQSGRFLRDFIWQGFNAAPGGGRVLDGALPTIAGSRKTFTNVRWGQPGSYSRQHEDHAVYGDQFPFSYGTVTDPLTGRSDGIFARCSKDATCPKLMHLDSSLEFWQARASLVVTDGAGKDIALPGNVRAYLMSSTQHAASAKPVAGICKLPNNPASQASTYRALMERLIGWTRDGSAPPPSRYPSVAQGNLVAPTPIAMGFPDLRALGLSVPARLNELHLVDHSVTPPRVDPRRYTVLVPRTDADGHDVAGVHVPDISVPLATHTGFNVRKAGFAEGQLCGLNGSYLPFASDSRQRGADRDPRMSIAERYASRSDYVGRVRSAAQRLEADGLMLAEDRVRAAEAAMRDPRVQHLAP